MKNSILLIPIFFVCFITISLCQEDISNHANEQLVNLMDSKKMVGVTAGFSIDGETRWSESAGFRNAEQRLPFEETTLTRIASIAKPMTSIAVMQLVEKGLIDLDAPIINFIPEYPKKMGNTITTRMLLAHTSGIKGYKGKESGSTTHFDNLTDAMQLFAERDLAFTPGTDFLYSSYGFVVVGVIIERVSGMPYEAYMRENIWIPAGMDQTSVENLDSNYESKSELYHINRKKPKVGKTNSLSNRIPGGGFITTLNDILKFGHAVIDNVLISQESFELITTISFKVEEGNPYGLGWYLYGPAGQENGVVGHGGGQIGANTRMFINPSRKIVVAVLGNTSGSGNGVTELAVKLLEQAGNISVTESTID